MVEIKTYLTFRIGLEHYAVGVEFINNIVQFTDNITKFPDMPGYVLGITDMREKILPVIDLKAKFEASRTEITRTSCILVTEFISDDERQIIGMLVDEVIEVLDIGNGNLKEPPLISKTDKNDYIIGIFNYKDDFAMILDINKVFESRNNFKEERLSKVA